MKIQRDLILGILKHKSKLTSLCSQNRGQFFRFVYSVSHSEIQPVNNSESTEDFLEKSILASQWHSIEQISHNLSPSLIYNVLFKLHESPELVLGFVEKLGFVKFDIKCFSLSVVVTSHLPSFQPTLNLLKRAIQGGFATNKQIFDGLVVSSEELDSSNSIAFDLLISAYCKLRKSDEALESFYFMKDKEILPQIETCNELLSLLIKQNRTETAWVLYAEMFRLKIKSSVFTFNIMINVLCKEGKLKKAKSFIRYMEASSFKPTVVTFNTLIQGYCWSGKLEGANEIFQSMKCKGINPDAYIYGSLISGLCKVGKFEEAEALFNKMVGSKLVPTAVTYNTLIDGYCNKGDLRMALHHRDEMVKKGIKPTISTYNLLVHATSEMAFVKKKRRREKVIIKGTDLIKFMANLETKN